MRRAFSNLRNGRSGPAIVEIPTDIWNEEIGDLDYTPVSRAKSGPDPADVRKAAAAILAAKRPVIYAGTGVHWAEAWPQLRKFAELLGAPVTTSLGGKSSFPENHPLSLGSGGNAVPKTVHHFIEKSDLIIGIGCSFTETNFGIKFPKGKKFIHATLDPNHLNKDVVSAIGLVGDAGLTLRCADRRAVADHQVQPRHRRPWWPRSPRCARSGWRSGGRCCNSNEAPISPYRVIWELMAGTDQKNTIITHDAGSPRDQISPFWVSTEPMSYIGWGKTTQLGMGLGLAMGAKLAKPDKLCINFWGDAAIGFTGHGLRDRGARAHPHPVLPDEQLLHGDRAEGDAGVDREVPVDRHLRQLCRHGEGVRRLRRARDGSRRRSRRRSSAASSRPRPASRHCWSSSPRRRRGFRSSEPRTRPVSRRGKLPPPLAGGGQGEGAIQRGSWHDGGGKGIEFATKTRRHEDASVPCRGER